jgi:hypothetical protein
MGMPAHQYNLAPFVASPFHFTWNSRTCASGPKRAFEENQAGPRHPICKVLEWQGRLLGEEGLSKSKIAKDEGITKARITQMFQLLNLPTDAQQHLAALRSSEAIRSFSLRGLFEVTRLPVSRRAEAFESLRTSSIRSGCK